MPSKNRACPNGVIGNSDSRTVTLCENTLLLEAMKWDGHTYQKVVFALSGAFFDCSITKQVLPWRKVSELRRNSTLSKHENILFATRGAL